MAGTYSDTDLLLAILFELKVISKYMEVADGEDSDDAQTIRYDIELAFGGGVTPYGNTTLSAASTPE